MCPRRSHSAFGSSRAPDISRCIGTDITESVDTDSLTVTSIVYAHSIDTTLFFSDLDNEVREWPLPDLTASVPDRAAGTLDTIVRAGDWCTLSEIAAETDQSKSTVIRHVNDLEAVGVLESDTDNRAKRVRVTFDGELLSRARRRR